MNRPLIAAVVTASLALAGGGCGDSATGPDAQLVVTKNFGNQSIASTSVPLSAGLTAMRQLEGSFAIETKYTGKYVSSIQNQAETGTDSWLFYVDGIESTKAATSVRLKPGQVVQWDLHDWQSVRGGGAIVGAYPRPLTSAPVQLVCKPATSAGCDKATSNLKAAGVKVATGSSSTRVVIGSWQSIAPIEGVPDLTKDGTSNGAYAVFSKDGGSVTAIRTDGSPGSSHGAGAGLIAATSAGGKTTWLVTGTDDNGVASAAALLKGDGGELKDRFVVLAEENDGGATPLPVEVN
jgi:hypothetical protein